MTRWCGTEAVVFCAVPPLPNSIRLALLIDSLGRISRNSNRQYDAPAAVLNAAPLWSERTLGSADACAGVIRMPSAGSDESAADDRIVM